MLRIVVPILLMLLLASPSFSQTSRIITFGELMEALKSGGTVKSTFYYGRSDLFVAGKKADRSPDVIAGMTINIYEHTARNVVNNPKAYVVFSESKLIENPLGEGYVYTYVKVQVYEDGQVTVFVRYVNPVTFRNEMEQQFETTLYDGQNKAAGAYFFVSS